MKRQDIHKIMIIGSGPIIIGQACEFDYSGTQACKALKKLGYEIVLVNSNPATIMTDPETADVTYIEPLNAERLSQIIEKERPDALLPNLGGQSGLNLCSELSKLGVLDKYNVKVIGVQVDAIERGEDRIEFKKAMNSLGIEMARSEVAYSVEDALAIADKLGYPVVLRPAYTMGGVGGGRVRRGLQVRGRSLGLRRRGGDRQAQGQEEGRDQRLPACAQCVHNPFLSRPAGRLCRAPRRDDSVRIHLPPGGRSSKIFVRLWKWKKVPPVRNGLEQFIQNIDPEMETVVGSHW